MPARLPLPPEPDDFLSYRLNFGSLEEEWQQHLNEFFHQSKEHALPWTVEGNLEPLTSAATRGPHSATVQVHCAGGRAGAA
jgi:hypothetical protein